MTDTNPPHSLPEVALADLPEKTKDYLLSLHATTGRPIGDLMREILNKLSNYAEGGDQ